MNWEAIGAIGEVSGAVAVVLTLLYLARQVSESRKATIAQIYQGRADAATTSLGRYSIGAKLAARIGAPDRGEEVFNRLSEEEREQLRLYLFDFMVRLDNVYFQYQQGLLPEDFFGNVRQSIRQSTQYRSALGVDIDRILVSQTFKDLVRSLDESGDPQ